MKKIILATTVAAFMLPAFAVAQDVPNSTMPGVAGDVRGDLTPGIVLDGEAGVQGGAMMDSGSATVTTDTATTGSIDGDASQYTIIPQTSNDVATGMTDAPAEGRPNRNTTEMSVNDTIAANPGLAEALAANSIEVSDIGSISVQPGNQVYVYSKTSN